MAGCRDCPSGQEVCRRCARRLCSEHTPFGGDACADCELAYLESRDDLQLSVWFVIGFMLPWVLLVALYDHTPSGSAGAGGHRAFSTGVRLLDVSIMAMAGAVLLGTTVRGLRIWLHRRRFLEPVRG